MKGTKFVSESYKDTDFILPISLDVLPLDNMPGTKREFKKQSRATWFWGRLLYLAGTPRPYLAIEGPLRTVVYATTAVVYRGLKLLRVRQRWIQQQWERAARRFESQSAKAMTDFSMRDPENWIVTYQELLPTKDVQFEGLTVEIPNEWDRLLRRGYGDYMQLPPVEQRKNHEPYLVDLGEFEGSESSK